MGRTPCAFFSLKRGRNASEQDIIDFCREHMAKFKAPKNVVFSDLPKASTGKVQKFILREKVKSMS
jgi:fatty-acyl-CoA synthase